MSAKELSAILTNSGEMLPASTVQAAISKYGGGDIPYTQVGSVNLTAFLSLALVVNCLGLELWPLLLHEGNLGSMLPLPFASATIIKQCGELTLLKPIASPLALAIVFFLSYAFAHTFTPYALATIWGHLRVL